MRCSKTDAQISVLAKGHRRLLGLGAVQDVQATLDAPEAVRIDDYRGWVVIAYHCR